MTAIEITVKITVTDELGICQPTNVRGSKTESVGHFGSGYQFTASQFVGVLHVAVKQYTFQSLGNPSSLCAVDPDSYGAGPLDCNRE